MYDWYYYINHLHHRINEQDQTIQSLQSRLTQLEHEQHKLNQENRQTIEKVEYNFDQLKIEHLDGTLHIGVSPDDLNSIEDMSVPGAGKSALNQQLSSELSTYLRDNGEQLIRDLAAQHQIDARNIDPAVLTEDIARQLPERIASHESEAKQNQYNLNHDELKAHITEQIKREIHHSLNQYMEGNDQTNVYGSS